MLGLVVCLLGLTIVSSVDTVDSDPEPYMSPFDGTCKICFLITDGIPCRVGPEECYGDETCRRVLVNKICPSIQRCNENSTIASRFPVVRSGETSDGEVYKVCECPICVDGDIDVDEDEDPLEDNVCCGIKRLDGSIDFVVAPRAKCDNIFSDERCLIDTQCSGVYDPVCDTDGNRYGNKCRARLAGKNITDIVPCRDECNCDESYRSPICVKVGDEYKTLASPCRYRCLKLNGLLPSTARIVGDDICKRDRFCRVRDSDRVPVCSTTTNTTFASLRECKCAGECLENAYTIGRCESENSCICSDLVADVKPLCRVKDELKETIRTRCEGLCSGNYDINNLKRIVARDGSVFTDGICVEDEDDCRTRDDVRIKCSEEDQRPEKPCIKVVFTLRVCYVDFIRRALLFDSIREALSRILYNQCGIQRLDTDQIFVTKFEPRSTTAVDVIRDINCTRGQVFDIAIAAYTVNYARIQAALDCFKTLGIDLVRKLKLRFLEAGLKRDTENQCQCSDTPDTVSCKGRNDVELDTDGCTDCVCERLDGKRGGFGDASVDESVDIVTTNYDSSVVEELTLDSNFGSDTTLVPGGTSHANGFIVYIAFIVAFIALLF